jgi:uncharacterized protein
LPTPCITPQDDVSAICRFDPRCFSDVATSDQLRVVALEEHWWPPELAATLNQLPPPLRDEGLKWFNGGDRARRLADLDDERLQDMDVQGVDLSVISVTTTGVQLLRAAEAVQLARAANDEAAAVIARHPDRLAAFATLPTPDGEAAAGELERAVESLGRRGAMLHGRSGNRHLDDPALADMFDVAARLDVPLYIHPQMPSRIVRGAYYDGFSDSVDVYSAGGGWGWHMETAIEAVRLILAGTFDRLPNLQIILGHWGDMVVFFLERLDIMSRVTTLERSVANYVRQNFSVTPSGILNQRLLERAVEEIGVERVMLSTDYPFQFDPQRNLKEFLARSHLGSNDQEAVASGNADRFLGPSPKRDAPHKRIREMGCSRRRGSHRNEHSHDRTIEGKDDRKDNDRTALDATGEEAADFQGNSSGMIPGDRGIRPRALCRQNAVNRPVSRSEERIYLQGKTGAPGFEPGIAGPKPFNSTSTAC